MTAKPLNHIIPTPEHEEEKGPLAEGFPAVVVGLALLVAWAAAFFVFGYPGLIVPALTLVAAIGGFIVWVSRG